MAKSNLKNYTSGDGFGAPLNMRRGNPNPLDNSELFESLEDAQNYASNSPIAYVGQLITTVIEDTDGNITNTTYRIEDEAGTLNKLATVTDIGSTPGGSGNINHATTNEYGTVKIDGETIIINENGQIKAVSSIEKLADIGDVNTSGATDGQALIYNAANEKWIPGETVSSIEKLADIGDVNVDGVTNGQALIYDDASAKWIPGEAGVSELSELSDVDVTSVTDGQSLVYDGTNSKWIPGEVVSSIEKLDDIGDVDVTSVTDGQALVYDDASAKWIPGETGVSELSKLSDVDVTSVTDGQALIYDDASAKWIPGEAGSGTNIWHGTKDEWDALPVNERSKYVDVVITDDYEPGNGSTGAGADIDDTTTANNKVWSSSKVNTELSDKLSKTATVADEGKVYQVDASGEFVLATLDPHVQSDWSQTSTTAKDFIKNKPKINGVDLSGDLSSEDLNITTETIEYQHDSIPSVDNIKEALDSIIDKLYYVKPSITSFSCDPSTLQYEIGNTVNSVSFSWALNKAVTSQTLTGVTLDPEDRSATYNTSFSSNKTFTLSVSDGENTATSSKAFTFLPKVYCGVDEMQDSYDSAFVVGLGGSLKSGKAGTYNLNIGDGKYGFIAVPTSYGKISVVKIGGFDTEMVDCGTISVTNESGYTQNYYLCRTPQPNLGNISMVVN